MDLDDECEMAEESPELEAELLKAANSPHALLHFSELREIADRALRDHRAKQLNLIKSLS